MIGAEKRRGEASEYVEYAQALGYVCHLASRTTRYALAPMALLPMWIEPAIWLGQICFLFDGRGQPVAYFTYAYLTKEVENRLLSDPRVTFHISEWKEGDRVWIMDMVAMPGRLRETLSLAAAEFSALGQVAYLRRGVDGQIKKVVRIVRSGDGLHLQR